MLFLFASGDRRTFSIGATVLWLGFHGAALAPAGQFETIGTPVTTAMLAATAVGSDEHGREVLYCDCAQPGSKLFLLQVNPETGAARQWNAPVGEGAWAIAIGPDDCVYLGTWESGYLLRFNPKAPDQGIVSLGKPSPSETYIWQLVAARDGRLYGCTYPGCKLVRYDPKSGTSEDLGRLDPKEMYARWIAESTNGFLYIAVGTVRAQIVRFDPKTGGKKPLFAENGRPPGMPHLFRGADGRVYVQCDGKSFLCDGDTLRPVTAVSARAPLKFKDQSEISTVAIERAALAYTLKRKSGSTVEKFAKFEGAGVRLFVVGAGPGGRIFGSTALPLEMFEFKPQSREALPPAASGQPSRLGKLTDLGNPTSVGGEIYSFSTDGKLLYLCAYPGSFLSIYDPAKPWHYGKERESNPRGFGPMGEGHLRPRAMAIGPDGRVYIGSLPPYGQTGGALGVYDPRLDAVTENYRNIVTNQGVSALCFEPQTERLFGGSSIEPGGGGVALARECAVFAWETKGRRKEWEKVIVKGDRSIGALTAAAGRVFGVSVPSSTLFVIDGRSFEVVATARVPYGHFHEISLGTYEPHQRIYGLAGRSLFAVDPKTFAMTEVARCPEPITCGFALADTGLYFGSGTRLMRWRWQ